MLPLICNLCTYQAMLQDAIDKAEGGGDASQEKTELEELKQLLPDIREKVEDAKESQRTASAASQAILQTLVGPKEQNCLGKQVMESFRTTLTAFSSGRSFDLVGIPV